MTLFYSDKLMKTCGGCGTLNFIWKKFCSFCEHEFIKKRPTRYPTDTKKCKYTSDVLKQIRHKVYIIIISSLSYDVQIFLLLSKQASILNNSGYNIVMLVHRKNDKRDYWSFWGTKGLGADFATAHSKFFQLFKLFINESSQG